MNAVEKSVTVLNRRGLHARAAAKFAKVVSLFEARVEIFANNLTVNGASIMGLMLLAASCGTRLLLRASGKEAEEVIDELTHLIEKKFGEED